MKYATEDVIDLPRERVIELFDNPDKLPKRQLGFESFEHFEGEEGKADARRHDPLQSVR